MDLRLPVALSNKPVYFGLLLCEDGFVKTMGSLWRRSIATDDGVRATFENQGDECQVSLSGRITIDSSPEFRSLLLKGLQSPACRNLIVDFHDVAYVDTSGLATLVEILKDARASGKAVRLTRLQERPHFLLEVTRLLHLFDEVNMETQASAPPERPQ
jgi:anti-sigma B factor antagonist